MFLNRTCVVTSIYGPQANNFSKSSLSIFYKIRMSFRCIFEIKYKINISNYKDNQADERSFEYKLKLFLENLIHLEEYPNS